MKNKVISTALFCFLTVVLLAQADKNTKKTSFWVGPQVSIAAADLAETHTVGMGVHTQLAHRIAAKTDLLVNARYNYFLGKKIDGYTEPGGGGSYGGGKFDGLNDVNITGGVRQHFGNGFFGDAEGGICLGFSGGSSETSGFGQAALGYLFNMESGFSQAIALFFGVCGDPKIQIGVRYGIRL